MPRVARVPAIPPLPPAIFAPPPWFSPLRPCHPPKRPIWWMNCPFVSAIHQNGSFCGWPPAPSPNRPGRGLVSRKVGAFSEGPSMPEACFPEGPDIILGDQPRRDRFFGRSWGCWQGRWCYPHVFCRGYCQKRRFLRVPSFVFPRVESLGPPADACQGRWCWWGVAGWGGTRRHATPG